MMEFTCQPREYLVERVFYSPHPKRAIEFKLRGRGENVHGLVVLWGLTAADEQRSVSKALLYRSRMTFFAASSTNGRRAGGGQLSTRQN